MFFIASKILHFLLKPILWIFFGCLFGVWKKRGNKPFWAGLFLFAYLISNQFLVDLVLRAYEPDAYPIREIPENINGIILLGGYSSYMEDAERSVFLSSADRFLQMLQVHRSKNISPVIITGGSGNLYKPEDTEAKFVAQYLKNTQLDTGQFWYEADSRNTYQNAVKSKELIENASMSKENWLLISSAFHIPRSLACYEKQGISVIPFPVTHKAGPPKFQFEYCFLPSVEALGKWEILMHEWIGYLSYKVSGKA